MRVLALLTALSGIYFESNAAVPSGHGCAASCAPAEAEGDRVPAAASGSKRLSPLRSDPLASLRSKAVTQVPLRSKPG